MIHGLVIKIEFADAEQSKKGKSPLHALLVKNFSNGCCTHGSHNSKYILVKKRSNEEDNYGLGRTLLPVTRERD